MIMAIRRIMISSDEVSVRVESTLISIFLSADHARPGVDAVCFSSALFNVSLRLCSFRTEKDRGAKRNRVSAG